MNNTHIIQLINSAAFGVTWV